MKNEVHEAVRPPAASDAALRERLRASLSETPGTELQALEERVMAQWQLRGGAAGPVPQGRGGVLALGERARALLVGVTILAMVAALGLQQMQKNSRAAIDDLAEPDVLSLISLGEL